MLLELKSDALKDRHWTQLFRVLKLRTPLTRLTLGGLWDANLAAHESGINEVLRAAQGEMGLAQFLGEVAEAWETRAFDMTTYRNKCRLIRGWDDLFEQLDEHLSALASMKLSPYVTVQCLCARQRLAATLHEGWAWMGVLGCRLGQYFGWLWCSVVL